MQVGVYWYWVKRIVVTHPWKGLETSRRSTWFWSSLEAERIDDFREASLLYQEGKWKIV